MFLWMSEYLTFITFIEFPSTDEESITGWILAKKLSLSIAGLAYYIGSEDFRREDSGSEDRWIEDLLRDVSGDSLSESLACGCKY